MNNLISHMCDTHRHDNIIICGDFNLPNINWAIPILYLMMY